MRKKLKPYLNQRVRFKAIVESFGKKASFRGDDVDTVLLSNVIIVEGNIHATNHIWITKTKMWQTIEIGDVVNFNAKVVAYTKGYKGYKTNIDKPIKNDYRIERPTKLEITRSNRNV